MVDSAMPPPDGNELDSFLKAFEAALASGQTVDLAAFLPPVEHPLRLHVLRELIRVEMEFGWSQGKPHRLSEYESRFPELFEDPESLEEVAYEEYRLRCLHGEPAFPLEYQSRFKINTDTWPAPPDSTDGANGSRRSGPVAEALPQTWRLPPASREGELREAAVAYAAFRLGDPNQDSVQLEAWCQAFQVGRDYVEIFREAHEGDPRAACRLAQASAAMPEPGMRFLDFRLIQELGRGTFARVFLARQSTLSNRLVALKISADIDSEYRALAQLQHTHIVPIYSVHRAGAFLAVCMPFFGSATLVDVLKEIRGSQTMPRTGSELVSTFRAKNSSVQLPREPASNSTDATAKPIQTLTNDDAETGFELRLSPARSTIPDVYQLQDMSYVQAVLWLVARIADALHHAHLRGIYHRDLKPANILLTDQGPMLLDFNLAYDSKLASHGSVALLGGTLPYMAPEHLEAFRGQERIMDAGCDIYSLGVILYELLTGQSPFPARGGSLRELLPAMIQDRQTLPPPMRSRNKAISRTVESIVRHCLEPDPARRYQSARELCVDLELHAACLPLEYAPEPIPQRVDKWLHRNWRLVGAAVFLVAAAVGITLGSLAWARQRELKAEAQAKQRELEAERPRLLAMEKLEEFERHRRQTRDLIKLRFPGNGRFLDSGILEGNQALKFYSVLDLKSWKDQALVTELPPQLRTNLQEEIGSLLFHLARATISRQPHRTDRLPDNGVVQSALRFNELAELSFPPGRVPRALWQQRADLAKKLNREAEALRLVAQAEQTPVKTADDYYLIACELVDQGEFAKALPFLEESNRQRPQGFLAWAERANCHARLGQFAKADECYAVCIALNVASDWAYYNRGLTRLNQAENYGATPVEAYASAVADFDETIRLNPDWADAYRLRAFAQQSRKMYKEALQDLEKALQLGVPAVQVLLRRARVRELANDLEGAKQDLEEGMRLEPADEEDWIARGFARIGTDPRGALKDFEKAVELNPRSIVGRQNQANVLGELLGMTEEGVKVLDQLVSLYPDYVHARASRGVYLARLGRRDEAHRDAVESIKRDKSPANFYQVAGIYAQTSKNFPEDRRTALRHLAFALRKDYGLQHVDSDPDIEPIRKDAEFIRLIENAKGLRLKPN